MKNRLFFLICFVFLILTLLGSCNLGEGKDPVDNGSDLGSGDVGDDFSDHENLIYASSNFVE